MPSSERIYKVLIWNHRTIDNQKAEISLLSSRIKELKMKSLPHPTPVVSISTVALVSGTYFLYVGIHFVLLSEIIKPS